MDSLFHNSDSLNHKKEGMEPAKFEAEALVYPRNETRQAHTYTA
ncbi:hypothetical protein [Bacteroides sp. 519]|nr:hypothetical protein [Bacteroides sp. 519]